MRRHPSGWSTILSQLGFKRTRSKKRKSPKAGRVTLIEKLEVRQLLTTVNTLVDVEDANDAFTSLREAIAQAPVGEVIDFDPSLKGGKIILQLGQLELTKNVTVSGPGANQLTIDANELSRVLYVHPGVASTISGLTLTGGRIEGAASAAANSGGGINNRGNLTLNSVEIIDNFAESSGGGIFVQSGGVVLVSSSSIHDNRAGAQGGGFNAESSTAGGVTIRDSTISQNEAGFAAGVYIKSTSGAGVGGGTIERTTVTANSAPAGVAGGLYLGASANVTVHNTIIAGNLGSTVGGSDIAGAISGTYNLIGVAGTSGLSPGAPNHNQVGSTSVPLLAGLSQLGKYGGTTSTHVPLPGSLAIDHGGGNVLAVDQRGFTRAVQRTAGETIVDVGATELSLQVVADADFNGDGRLDQLLWDAATGSLQVLASTASASGKRLEHWGALPVGAFTAASPFVVGDFNGDGRDDVMVKKPLDHAWFIAVSDNTLFHIHDLGVVDNWTHRLVGDFDGDGSDDLLGGTAAGAWSIVRYSDLGVVASVATVSLPGFSTSGMVFAEDANRDGREDLITRSGATWMVRLAGTGADGLTTFQGAADLTAWIGYGFNAGRGALNADAAMAKVIEEFAWVYNNVELELYPGLMKGPEATRQTKTGNNWDQAALLEQMLDALPFLGAADVKIATGKVRASVDQVRNWLGLESTANDFTLLHNALASDAVLVGTTVLEFTHAWVQAYVPTASGMAWVNLDPSWKFKDRQARIGLPSELDNIHIGRGLFDEFSYLGLPTPSDKRLPIEFFEDQVMEYLAKTPSVQGASLANVAYDGPIKTRLFQSLPSGLSDGLSLAPTPGVATYDGFAAIASNSTLRSELTHRVRISLKKGATEHWYYDMVVPAHSLDTIEVTFGSSSTIDNPNMLQAVCPFYGRLVVNGTVVAPAIASQSFDANDIVTIELTHSAPTRLTAAMSPSDPNYVGPSAYDRRVTLTETPGDIIAIGLEANQYSRDSLMELQAALLASVASHTTTAEQIGDIDQLTSYAIAKYWHDYQMHNDAIAGLTGAVGFQQWVGSGHVKAKPSLLLDPEGGFGDTFINYLSFGMAPQGFGIDLPNGNNVYVDVASGFRHAEARQLGVYNSSALEHSIVEEITSAEGVSTIKGLQRSYRRNLGINASGIQVSDDVIHVFESRYENNARSVYHVFDVRSGGSGGVQIGQAEIGVQKTESEFKAMLASHNLQGNSGTNVDDTLWNELNALTLETTVEVTALATKHRTKLPEWVGAVYILDQPELMNFIIAADGGSSSNGGYLAGTPTAPPTQYPTTNSINASWAGDPVNTANGNMFRDETDVVFPNIGVPLDFTRHYDSKSTGDIGMGVGWTHSFGDLLFFDPKDPQDSQDVDAIVWLDAVGRRHRFEKLPDGTYQTPSGLTGKFTAINNVAINSGAVGFTFEDSTGMVYRFHKLDDPTDGILDTANLMRHSDGAAVTIIGRLREQVDRNGDGVVVKYTSTSGRTIEYVYDVHSTGVVPARRLQFTNPAGVITAVAKYDNGALIGTWDYGYESVSAAAASSTKRLASVEAPAVSVANASYVNADARPKVQYAYNNAANHFSQGLIERITEADGSWHTYEYFVNGRVFCVRQGDVATPIPTLFAPGAVVFSEFVGVNNMASPNNYNVTSTGFGGVFDSMRGGPEPAAYLADTSLVVPNGILNASTFGGFGATGTLWFDASHTASATSPLIYFGFFDKDALPAGPFGVWFADNQPSWTSFEFVVAPGGAYPESARFVVGEGTYRFDLDVNNADSGSGNVRFRLFSPTSTVMDKTIPIPSGSSVQADSFGIAQHYNVDYDPTFEMDFSNVSYTGETRVASALATVDPRVAMQTFNYNVYRRQTEFTDELGNLETSFHQDNGLRTKVIHDDRSRQTFTWGAADTAEEQQMLSTTDERGAKETFAYYGSGDPEFKRGQLKESTAKHFSGTPLVTRYDYEQPDAAKPHLVALWTTVVDPTSAVADPASGYYQGQKLTTTRSYHPSGDALGKLWKVTDPQANVTEYTYYPTYPANDPNFHLSGLLKTIKSPAVRDADDVWRNYETHFNYDAAGNVISTTTQVATTSFKFDAMGKVVRTADPTGVAVESVYDVLGRLRETGYGDANPDVNPLDAFTSKFKYDALGRVRESVDPLGRVTRFEYDRQGKVVKQINPDLSEITHQYDAFGNCIAKTDGLGRTTRFVYDGRNRLVQTLHPDGALERLRYDGAGNVVATIDALGAVTTFKYDAAGRLLETKLPDPDGEGLNNPLLSPTTTNKYDKLGNLVETVDPELNVTQYKYDELGQVVQIRTRKGDGTRSASLASASPYNLLALQTIDYDARGNVSSTVAYDVSRFVSTAAEGKLAVAADVLNDPRTLINPANQTANFVQVVSTRYDAFNRPVKVTNADGTITRTTYHPAGRVLFQTDERGGVTEFQYDQFGRLIATKLPDPTTGLISAASPTTTYRLDAVGNRTATTDSRGFTTRYEYDAFNRLVATTDAHGARSQLLYDVAGQLVATVDALGRAAYTLYDQRGRAVAQRQADPDGSGAGLAPVTRHRYDAAGRVVETIDPLGYYTEYVYDRLGRLRGEIATTEYYVVDSGDPTSYRSGTSVSTNKTTDYDGDSSLVVPNGSVPNPTALWGFANLTPGVYRMLATWAGDASATSSMLYRISDSHNGVSPAAFFPADASGYANQRVASAGVQRQAGAAWHSWQVLHSGFSLHSGSTTLGVHFMGQQGGQPILADAVRIERLASRQYEYDANGNLVAETDPLGRVTTYVYDELGRLTVETLPDPDDLTAQGGANGELPRPQTTTSYDGYGNVASVLEHRRDTSNQRKTTYAYDARNRRTEQIVDAGPTGGVQLNLKTTWLYDDVVNRTDVFEWSAQGALLRQTIYAYDRLDRLTVEVLNAGTASLADQRWTINHYDSAGNLTRIERDPLLYAARSFDTFHEYDALGRLLRTTDRWSDQSTTAVVEERATSFQYDAVGNLLFEIDALGRMTRRYVDRLDRTIATVDPDPDGAGQLGPEFTTYAYDAAGRVVSQTNALWETERYAYDAQGRLVEEVVELDGPDDVTRRQYDTAGNLIQLVDPAGNATTYRYDLLDRQTHETTAAGTRETLYDRNGNAATTIDRNGRVVKYVYDRLDRVDNERWYADSLASASQWIAEAEPYYDDLGRTIERQHRQRTAPGAATYYRVTDSWQYDGLDRLTEHSNQSRQDAGHTVTAAGVPAPVLVQTYGYEDDGTQATETRQQFVGDVELASTASEFDPWGALRRASHFAGPPGGLDFESHSARFFYDASGALVQTSRLSGFNVLSPLQFDSHVETLYGYDDAGRLQSLAHQGRDYGGVGTATPYLSFAYGYDAAGRIDALDTDWNQNLDALEERADENQLFAYDAAGQLTGVDSNLSDQDASYDLGLNGNRESATEPGGGTDAYLTPSQNRTSQDSTLLLSLRRRREPHRAAAEGRQRPRPEVHVGPPQSAVEGRELRWRHAVRDDRVLLQRRGRPGLPQRRPDRNAAGDCRALRQRAGPAYADAGRRRRRAPRLPARPDRGNPVRSGLRRAGPGDRDPLAARRSPALHPPADQVVRPVGHPISRLRELRPRDRHPRRDRRAGPERRPARPGGPRHGLRPPRQPRGRADRPAAQERGRPGTLVLAGPGAIYLRGPHRLRRRRRQPLPLRRQRSGQLRRPHRSVPERPPAPGRQRAGQHRSRWRERSHQPLAGQYQYQPRRRGTGRAGERPANRRWSNQLRRRRRRPAADGIDQSVHDARRSERRGAARLLRHAAVAHAQFQSHGAGSRRRRPATGNRKSRRDLLRRRRGVPRSGGALRRLLEPLQRQSAELRRLPRRPVAAHPAGPTRHRRRRPHGRVHGRRHRPHRRRVCAARGWADRRGRPEGHEARR